MTTQCTHLDQIQKVASSAPGCEDCLKTETSGYICVYACSADMWVAAIRRRINMRLNISAPPDILLFNLLNRAKSGVGVIWIRPIFKPVRSFPKAVSRRVIRRPTGRESGRRGLCGAVNSCSLRLQRAW